MPAHRRPDGTLLAEGFAARAGILVYRNPDGSPRRELVRADTLARSAGGLGRAVVTLGHPDEDVTPENYKALAVGDTDGDVVVEAGGFIRVRMAVRDAAAVQAVDAGTQELSPGYLALVDETPGVDPEFGAYDAEQVERAYNHLAIVDAARGGHEVRFRADGLVSTGRIERRDAAAEGAPMIKARLAALLSLLGISQRADTDDQAIELAIEEATRRRDALDAAKTAAATAHAAVAAERDREKARADAAEAEVARLRAADLARVDAAELEELRVVADRLGIEIGKDAKLDQVRRDVAEKHLGAQIPADASADYIAGLTAAATIAARQQDRGRAAADQGREAGRRAWTETREDRDEPRTVRRSPGQISRERYQNAFNEGRK